MSKTAKMAFTALLAAFSTITSSLVAIPLGFAKIFPVQHFANVLSAVLLGPWYALAQAFVTSLFRNLLGTGSLFAFPGSMIGAFLDGVVFARTGKIGAAVLGEVIGTSIIGSVACYSIGAMILGRDTTLFGLVPSFAMSSFAGSVFGYILLKGLLKNKALEGVLYENSLDDRRF